MEKTLTYRASSWYLHAFQVSAGLTQFIGTTVLVENKAVPRELARSCLLIKRLFSPATKVHRNVRSKGGKTGKFARFYFCCFSVESTPQAFKADLCCLHLGSGHIGADDVGSMIIGCAHLIPCIACSQVDVLGADCMCFCRPAGPSQSATSAALGAKSTRRGMQDTSPAPRWPPAGRPHSLEVLLLSLWQSGAFCWACAE